MQRFACLDFTAISSDVVLYPGTLHEEDELHIKLALHEDSIAFSLAHSIPSTDGIANLYTPFLSVVLLTDNEICSVVFGETALNVQSILTSTPGNTMEYMKKPDQKGLKSRNGYFNFRTWHEVAVPGEGVVGANVTVNNTHDSDLGVCYCCCFNF
ncbi:unnamed protein product [Camellia sinensis]